MIRAPRGDYRNRAGDRRASRIASPGSDPWSFAIRTHVHSAHLRRGALAAGGALTATAAARQDLARIQAALGIECVAQPRHHREVAGLEQLAHHRALLHPDAVLARDRAAHPDAHAQNLVRSLERPSLRRRTIGIDEDV